MSLNIRNGLRSPVQPSAPSTPATGQRLLYPRSDGWYDVDSTGAEVRVGAPLNNPSFSGQVYADSAYFGDQLDVPGVANFGEVGAALIYEDGYRVYSEGNPPVIDPASIGAVSTKGGGKETITAGSATTGTVNLDLAVASVFTVSPTGNVTLLPIGVPGGGVACTITVVVTQGATVRTVALSNGVWLGSAPTQVANKKCVITMMTVDGGTSWLCSGAVQV